MSLFRPMTVKDLPRVIELLRQIGASDFPEPSEDRLLDFLELPTFHPFVLENSTGLVVAMGILIRMPNLKYDWCGYFDYVVVDEAYRYHGFGRMVITNLIDEARALGCRSLFLTTSNPVARRLYESYGFAARLESVPMKRKL